MKVTRKSRGLLRLAGASFVLLALILAAAILWVSYLYQGEIDLTRSGRNSLSESSIAAVQNLDNPLRVSAFAGANPAYRTRIDQLVQSYQRYKDDITLVHVDPNAEPQRVRDAGIRFYDQLLLEYEGAREILSSLTEEAFSNALTRLGHRKERWLVFLGGHGERRVDRDANFDMSKWSEQLQQRGFRTRALSLAENPQIPQNTSVLVIAGPQVKLLPGEIKEVRRYVNDGGNLLWLTDPGSLQGLESLAEQLAIEIEPGTIVDPRSQQLTGRPTALVISDYGNHPAVKDFHENTVFPSACGISIPENDSNGSKPFLPPDENEWQHQVLLDTRASSWSETGPVNRAIRFDKGKDIAGPLNISVAITRKRDKNEQRIIVVCDGDFASNAFILRNGANLDFAMSIINWLSRDDAYINIPVRVVADQTLQMSITMRNSLMALFAIIIPILLVACGIVIWLQRRKR
ncbi:MAG: GldG family protein [Acidiferrobacterales bacterium]